MPHGDVDFGKVRVTHDDPDTLWVVDGEQGPSASTLHPSN